MALNTRPSLGNMLRLSRRVKITDAASTRWTQSLTLLQRNFYSTIPISPEETSQPPSDAVFSNATSSTPPPNPSKPPSPSSYARSPRYDAARAPQTPSESIAPNPRRNARWPVTYPLQPASPPLSPSVREQLPILAAQKPHYIIIHIHAKPYLVTAGDTLRLPFLMHGVSPGDVLRLNRATVLGSRDWTLKAGHTRTSKGDAKAAAEPIIGRTDGLVDTPAEAQAAAEKNYQVYKAQPKYLDDSLYVCRATVMGTESEPMRFTEKTRPRRRKVRTMKSKHKYTVLRIREITVRTAEEIEAAVDEGAASTE